MILIGTQDVGPAKYLAALFIDYNPDEILTVWSNLNESILSGTGEKVKISEIGSISKLKVIITGTCTGNGIDKKLIQIGKYLNIPSVSVIEHWNLYLYRFFVDGKTLLPNYIFLNDNHAMKSAIEDGLPKDLLYAYGNPYLEQLQGKDLSPVDKKIFKLKFGLQRDKILIFISEELNFKKNSDGYRGFCEFEVLSDIIKSSSNKNIDVLIKLHPEEALHKYNCFTRNERVCVAKDNLDFDTIISHADIIIGMDSMMLIEASLFRNDIISYRPRAVKPFIGSKLKILTEVGTKESLERILSTKNNQADKKLDFAGSKERLLTHINTIIKRQA